MIYNWKKIFERPCILATYTQFINKYICTYVLTAYVRFKFNVISVTDCAMTLMLVCLSISLSTFKYRNKYNINIVHTYIYICIYIIQPTKRTQKDFSSSIYVSIVCFASWYLIHSTKNLFLVFYYFLRIWMVLDYSCLLL